MHRSPKLSLTTSALWSLRVLAGSHPTALQAKPKGQGPTFPTLAMGLPRTGRHWTRECPPSRRAALSETNHRAFMSRAAASASKTVGDTDPHLPGTDRRPGLRASLPRNKSAKFLCKTCHHHAFCSGETLMSATYSHPGSADVGGPAAWFDTGFRAIDGITPGRLPPECLLEDNKP